MKRGILTLLASVTLGLCLAQKRDVIIDEKGVMRWPDTKEEVKGFGVNYTVPFAHAYRSAKKLGIDPKDAIRKDVYHFARLGFDAYRVHVWDTEISDSVGNLIANENLELFDFMLKEMRDRGMNFLITPIAFWGNGWPEPDTPTPGFSSKYGKGNCLTNEEAIKAQENYLYQFLNHVNPYTGIAYKDDPTIIAFEISNEPHHRQPADSVTRYVKKMVDAMRRTGCGKPILYNISHGVHLVDAYFDAGIQGGTFQWYPTGLGFQKELQGNFLPNVDLYKIPFAENPRFKQGVKVVYEFDAADVGRSYMYPAMARSFRTAGIQWATHFAYDPTFLAYANTEYNTHYMNLAYTPSKALALKISGEVFHQVPLYKDYGKYPQNARFDGFRVSYEDDLGEYVSPKKFIYTNNTAMRPTDLKTLEEIAGFGNSEVVKYEGQGAYFLNKIEKGVWRLEVMPDAIWTGNPFGKNSLNRALAVINWQEWRMQINLTDLGLDFQVKPVNEGNSVTPTVSGNGFSIPPGTYLITRKGVTTKLKGTEQWKNIRLNEFTAPAATLKETYVSHTPANQLNSGSDYRIAATVAGLETPEELQVLAYAGSRPISFDMKRTSGYQYEAVIPAEHINEGYFRYFIVLKERGASKTYPMAIAGRPGDWDFDASNPYSVPVVAVGSPVYLFNAGTDNEYVSRNWAPGSGLLPLSSQGSAELQLKMEKLFTPDEEDLNATPIYDYSLRYSFKDQVSGVKESLTSAKELVIRGRSLTGKDSKIQVALVSDAGEAYGAVVSLDTETAEIRVPFSELKKVPMVTLPRPYPTFLPYYFEGRTVTPFDIATMETLQISIGPGLSEAEAQQKQAVGIESVWVE